MAVLPVVVHGQRSRQPVGREANCVTAPAGYRVDVVGEASGHEEVPELPVAQILLPSAVGIDVGREQLHLPGQQAEGRRAG